MPEMDNRAQSIGLARFILSLLVGVPVIWITTKITDPILSESRNATSHNQANQATTWIGQAIDYMPIWFLIIAFMGTIVVAIYQRERLR